MPTDYLLSTGGNDGRPPARVCSRDSCRLSGSSDRSVFRCRRFVASRYQDVLAANPIARALSPGVRARRELPTVAPFWRRPARDLYVDWDEATEAAGKWVTRKVRGNRFGRPPGCAAPDRGFVRQVATASAKLWGARRRRGVPLGHPSHATPRGRRHSPLPQQAQRSALRPATPVDLLRPSQAASQPRRWRTFELSAPSTAATRPRYAATRLSHWSRYFSASNMYVARPTVLRPRCRK